MQLPDAREDGKCCRCNKRLAATRDGRFCRSCLRKVINDLSPDVRDLSRENTEQIGRKSISLQATEGSAEMGTAGDDW
jgi:predicted amidophosphoribosyltransferase